MAGILVQHRQRGSCYNQVIHQQPSSRMDQDLYQPIADIFSCAISAINSALSKYISPERVQLEIPKIWPAEDVRPKIEWKGLPTN